MYGNDGKTQQDGGSRFHDIIHNVNNDGLEDMAWPGALARHKDNGHNSNNGDNGSKGIEEQQTAKTTQAQTTTQTQQQPSVSSPKSQPIAHKDTEPKPSKPVKVEPKNESRPVSESRQPKPKPCQKHETTERQEVVITDEWTDFEIGLENYDSREEGAERHSIYLPKKVYNTYQTVFSRDMSAAISTVLKRFIDRNKGKMSALIDKKSDLLKK